jgi:hypothetical protein
MSNIDSLNVAQSVVSSEQQSDVSDLTLRVIPEGENFSAVTRFLGDKKVTATYSFRPHAKGTRYEKTTLFDFSNVSEEQLYLLAMYGVKVTVQHILRNLSPAEMIAKKTMSTVDVLKGVIENSVQRGDPETVARRQLLKLSHAQRKALLAELSQDE